MDNSIVGIGIALGVSFFILYTRKTKWMTEKIVWLICSGLLVIGLFGFLYFKSEFRNDQIMYFGFCVPIVYWIFDRIFKKISERLHERDFILFLRYSDEINDQLGAKNTHVKNSNRSFSFGLLIIIVGTLFIEIQTI